MTTRATRPRTLIKVGQAEDSGRGTIESLVDVAESLKGRISVIHDGGSRRGACLRLQLLPFLWYVRKVIEPPI